MYGNDIEIIVASNSLPYSRFAVRVGMKTDKKSSTRNRIKRLLREARYNILPTIKPGLDCIAVASKNIATREEREVRQSLQTAFRHFQILNDSTI